MQSNNSNPVFSFCHAVQRLTKTKNSVVKIQNFIVNYESRPVQSNPVMYNYLKMLSFNHNFHKKKKKDDFVTFVAEKLHHNADTFLFNLKSEKYDELCFENTLYII